MTWWRSIDQEIRQGGTVAHLVSSNHPVLARRHGELAESPDQMFHAEAQRTRPGQIRFLARVIARSESTR
jgi:transcription elongation GreA/GreB family factor